MTRPVAALLALAFVPVAFAQDEAPAAPEEASDEAPATEEPASGPVTYALQPAKSVLSVLVKYDRNALIGGHDHIIQPATFDGTVTWDAADPSACEIEIGFPVDQLQVDPPGARGRAGLEGTTGDGDKKTIKNNMLGKSQLQSSNYPRIEFASTKCVKSGDRYDVTGPLTLRGTGHDVTASMKITADGETFTASGGFDAVHADWGFDPYTALFGSLKNDKALAFTIDVTGAKK